MIVITVLGLQQKQEAQTQIQSIPDKIQENELLWLDAENPTEEEIEKLQRRFDLDSYAIEDVVHGRQRSKVEEYKGNNFSVIHVPVSRPQTESQQRTMEN